jgi:hypothetical protein
MIPDHDGRQAYGDLGVAFERIDADRRLRLYDGDRRVFRAAAAYDHGSELDHHRELGLAVAEIAARLGMTDADVRRLMLSPHSLLIGSARRRWGLG